VRGTYFLDTTEGGTSQDTEIKRPSESHSHPGDSREGQVSTREESGRASGTHQLGTAEGLRGRDKSGHKRKSVRNHTRGANGGRTDRILVLTVFQHKVTIQTMVLQPTQSDGKATIQVFITASVLPFLCSKS